VISTTVYADECEHADLTTTLRARRDDDFGDAIACHVAAGHTDAPAKRGFIREETRVQCSGGGDHLHPLVILGAKHEGRLSCEAWQCYPAG